MLFGDFLFLCGINDHDQYLQLPLNQNVALSFKILELIRYHINALPSDIVPQQRIRLAQKLAGYGKQQGWDKEPLNVITREHYEYLLGHFAESNRQLAQTYLGRDGLFMEPYVPKPISTFRIADLSDQEMEMVSNIVTEHLQEVLSEGHK